MEYNQLKASIAAVIKTNNRKEITGQLLQNVLFQMTNVIGENLQLAGFATPLTDPHEPDQNLFYITDQGGVYPHFDNLTVDDGLTFLMWKNGEWTSHTVGVVTQEWVDSHYVSIDFFRSLFRAYDSAGLEILPNNNPEDALPTVVDNIKAMVGFWTEQYISALGQQTGGGGGGGATSLDELSDVFLTNPSLGQALVFTITPDHPEGIWVNQTIQAGTDMATVWAALAGNTTQQINISHLTDALADYATKTYVDQNFITVAYFDRLFRAYNGSTLVSHNDVTSTIDNIKAMFGFWTEQYLSALGNNSGGGGQLLALSNMADVTLTTPIADKQVLTFDAVTQKWVNGNAQAGATALANLTDVLLTTPAYGQFLYYDGTKWANIALKTINSQSLIGSGDISVGGGATGNYLPLTGGTVTGQTIFSYQGDAGLGNSNPALIIGGTKSQSHIEIDDNEIVAKSNATGTGTLFLQWDSGNLNLCRDGITSVGNDNLSYYEKFNVNGSAGVTNILYVNDIRSNPNSTNGDRYGLLTIKPTKWTGVGSNEWAVGSDAFNGVIRAASTLYIYRGGTRYTNIDSAGGTFSGRVVINLDNDAEASDYNSGSLRIGTAGGNHLLLDGNEIVAASGNSTGTLFLQYNGGTIECGGGSNVSFNVRGSIYATGAITALSDARKKDIMGEAGVTVEQIAHAPAVQFLWKDKERRKDGQQVGTLAQYWQTVLPEVVSDKGGELSMQYGVAALVSSIIIARKVANHEVRIDRMEKWMKKWVEENDE